MRHLSQLLAEALAWGLAGALAGTVVLLAAGTGVLDARWLAAAFLCGLGLGMARMRKRILDRYRLAQALDRRLGLEDTLSTAIYFEQCAEARDAEAVRAQWQVATRLSRGLDLRAALPWRMPRALAGAAALGVAAAALVALRYGITGSLSLEPPLMRVDWDTVAGGALPRLPARRAAAPRARDFESPRTPSAPPRAGASPISDAAAPLDALRSTDEPDVENSASGAKSARAEAQPGDPAGSRDGAGRNRPAGDPGRAATPNPGQPGLMERMKDAMADLYARLSAPSQSGDSPQQASNGKEAAARGKQQGMGKDGSASPPGQQAAVPSGEDPAEASARGGQKAAEASGRGPDRGNGPSDSKDARSGIGSEDGNKELKLAEQRAAMGKISEIIGKRSASVRGEMTVETASGPEQLRTGYSLRQGARGDAGGGISRDEVPLAYRQYVLRYFESLRKLPPTPAGAPR